MAKNDWLLKVRGVTFEDVLLALEQGSLLDVMAHGNQARYGHQRVLVVIIRRYVYMVPYVEEAAGVFLKTVIPSRKLTRRYFDQARRP